MNTKTQDKISARIKELREQLGDQVVLLGHHYQDQAVIDHCDIVGDSLELAKKSAELDNPHIVFCGVYFMGESAALLAKEGQNIYLPDPKAECDMALMAPAEQLEKVMQELTQNGKKVIPLAYVNTSFGVKAVVGKYGGAVCTSANAQTLLRWALDEGDGVLFVPDKNLAYNTAKSIGVQDSEILELSLDKEGNIQNKEEANKTRLLLWPGYCFVHARFTTEHIEAFKKTDPQAKLVVHPECEPAIVAKADSFGSTTHIINYAKSLPKGSSLYIGTEINLVERLQKDHAENVNIKPLFSSACPDMAMVTLEKICQVLEDIANGTAKPVYVEKELIAPARASLEKMLSL